MSEIEGASAKSDDLRLLQQERAILEITELLCDVMEEENVSRADLAERLGRTKGYVTQLLDGRRNMTVRTISDVFYALGRAVHFSSNRMALGISAPVHFSQASLEWKRPVKDCWSSNKLMMEHLPMGNLKIAS